MVYINWYYVVVLEPADVRQEYAIICLVESAMTICRSFKILRYWDIHYRWNIVIFFLPCDGRVVL